MQQVVDDLKAWLHAPFSANMDWLTLFLSVGLVLIIALFWMRVLSHLDIEGE